MKDWSATYRARETPWELWGPTPALQSLLERGFFAGLGIGDGARIGVPGCGRGHDLRLLAELGAAVTGFDVAPEAVAEARELLALNRVDAAVLRRDVLGLVPEFAGAFDLVYDYTCLCALPPALRPAYARVLRDLLAPGGQVLALVFPMDPRFAGVDGPPYLLTEPDLEASLGTVLRLEERFETGVAASPRAGAERWYRWRAAPE